MFCYYILKIVCKIHARTREQWIVYFFLLGIIAEEVLYACDENTIAAAGGSATGGELGLANPAVHFFR